MGLYYLTILVFGSFLEKYLINFHITNEVSLLMQLLISIISIKYFPMFGGDEI
jgi:hypothetical protein